MASAEIRQRTKEQEQENPENINSNNISDMNSSKPKKPKNKSAIAKRGLRSLAIAIGLPLTLTLLDIIFFGSTNRVNNSYLIPVWALHLASVGSAALMGLSAWLVWAEGGFHRKPEALMVYLGQVGLSLVWEPVVLGLGARWIGLVVCVGLIGALVGCSRMFRVVNPVAGHLVKPCLVSAGLVAVTNIRLVYS